MDAPLDFDAISLLYGATGLFAFYRLVQQRRSFFDHFVTAEDINLAWLVALFLLTPLAVLLHEAGHYFAAQYFGATEIELHHRGYWGFVRYSGGSLDDVNGGEIMYRQGGSRAEMWRLKSVPPVAFQSGTTEPD